MSISLNALSSEVERAHRRIDDLELKTKSVYTEDVLWTGSVYMPGSITVSKSLYDYNLLGIKMWTGEGNRNNGVPVMKLIPVSALKDSKLDIWAGGDTDSTLGRSILARITNSTTIALGYADCWPTMKQVIGIKFSLSTSSLRTRSKYMLDKYIHKLPKIVKSVLGLGGLVYEY